MENYRWKKCTYKLMTGRWKIWIVLEAGYQLQYCMTDENGLMKLTNHIYFHTMFLPYPASQMLSKEEISYFCNGLKAVSKQISKFLDNDLYVIIALRSIQFLDCDIQNEAFTVSAIQWSSEIFEFPMPDIKVYFDRLKGRNGIYVFDFSSV